jgi:hypothetical protein
MPVALPVAGSALLSAALNPAVGAFAGTGIGALVGRPRTGAVAGFTSHCIFAYWLLGAIGSGWLE